jgi:MOSC domain-containing protein YiiM
MQKIHDAMRILSVNVARARTIPIDGRAVATAIGKRPVDGPVEVHALGLAGDEQADPTVHGGLAKAIYAYPSVHLRFWQTVRAQAGVAAWDAPVPPGLVGENLTVEGLDEARLWIGDRLRLPGCVLAVSEPRYPCFKFNAAMGFPQAARLMLQSGYCGAYLGVVEPGRLCAGDPVVLEPGPREINLRELFRARTAGRRAAD